MDPASQLDSVGQRKLWYRWAKLAIARGHAHKSLRVVDDLIATAPGTPAGESVPALLLLRGQALARLGEFESAIAELRGAYSRERSLHDRSLQLRLRFALAGVHRAAGQLESADDQDEIARGIVEEIAALLPTGEWRARFIAGTSALLES
jgi:Flp pilus assembly protein TadD